MAKRQGPHWGESPRTRRHLHTARRVGDRSQGLGKCRKHFGNARSVIKAAENERVDQQARMALAGITDFEAITEPVERLQLLDLLARVGQAAEDLGPVGIADKRHRDDWQFR